MSVARRPPEPPGILLVRLRGESLGRVWADVDGEIRVLLGVDGRTLVFAGEGTVTLRLGNRVLGVYSLRPMVFQRVRV